MVDCLIMALIFSSSDALESIRLPVYEQKKLQAILLAFLLHQYDHSIQSCHQEISKFEEQCLRYPPNFFPKSVDPR